MKEENQTRAEKSKCQGQMLLESMVSRQNMVEAFKRVKSNKGAGGVDGVEIEGFKTQLDLRWNGVKTAILEGSYQPEAVRRVEIPKPNGGIRLLGIPTLMDRLIQQAIGQELVKLYEGSFSEFSYGFRPSQSATGLQSTVETVWLMHH